MEAIRAHPEWRWRAGASEPRPAARDPPARTTALERLTTAADRRLVWDACVNVRDLGGLHCGGATLRRGRLIRGSTLGALTAAGRVAMFADGVRTVLDLRGDDEVAQTASPFAGGVTYLRVPLTSMRMMALHEAAHAGTLPDELRAIAAPEGGVAAVVRAVAAAEPAVLLHCAAGRDRTGLTVALILAAMGVPDDEVIADYVASDDEMRDEYVRFKAANPDRATAVDAGVAKRAWVMAETLRVLRQSFGGAASYLVAAGARVEDLAAIELKLTS